MRIKRLLTTLLLLFFVAMGIIGCADKKPVDINVSKMAEFSDSRGQANVKLFMYSGEAKIEDIKAYTEKLGCNMLFAYFYPDTVPLGEIPVEEIRSAKSYTEAHDILFNGEGYARWRFATHCFAVIPIVTDCNESSASQNCR